MKIDGFDKRIIISFVIISFLVMLEYPAEIIFNGMPFLLFACSMLFIFIVLLYCFESIKLKGGKKHSPKLFNYTVYIYIISALLFLAFAQVSFNAIALVLSFVENVVISFILYILVFFMMSLGAYFIYVAKRPNIGIAIFAMVLAILIAYFFLGFNVHAVNDENIMMLYDVKFVLNGTNPYTTSIGNVIYTAALDNFTRYTLESDNTIASINNYPSLYFLTFLPFYFLSNPTIYNLKVVDMPVQSEFFIFILLVTVYCLIDKKDILKIDYVLLIFLSLILINVISTVTYLMLAVILLAYAKIDSKYSWILLGVAASLQEELWLPVLLLIGYSFNNYGARKGMRDLIGTAAIFLLFNGYFIIQSPSAYIHTVFLPENGFQLIDPYAPIGYFIFMHYDTLATLFGQLFLVGCIGALLASLYFNNKKAIPLLSVIPFMFLTHGVASYYYFFMVFFVLIIYFKEEKHDKGRVRKLAEQSEAYRYLFMGLCALVLVGGALLIYLSHAAYAQSLNLSVSNQAAYISANTLHYSSILHYNLGNPNASQLYVLLDVYPSNGGGVLYGTNNNSILSDSVNCSYPCSINTNKIYLNGSQDTYDLSAYVSNFTGRAYISALIYNGQYVYQSQMISVNDT